MQTPKLPVIFILLILSLMEEPMDPDSDLGSSDSDCPSPSTSAVGPQSPSLRRRRSSTFPSDSVPVEKRERILKQSDDAAPETSSSPVTLDGTAASRDETLESSIGGLLFWIAGFVIKAIFFHLNFLVTSFLFPLRSLYFLFLLVTDPSQAVKRAVDAIMERFLGVWNGVMTISSWLFVGVGSEEGLGKLMMRLMVGCFWFVYVGFILAGILVTAFVSGGLLISWISEEPLQVVRELNFDFTNPNPDAFVPIDPEGVVDCRGLVSAVKDGFREGLGPRVVPMNHRLQLVISLVLPESDYNKRLGMFQVRSELISASGKATCSSSQPCMLRFKSPHFRFIETFLKTGTLLAGYSSESQTLDIKMSGFIEGNDPTVCVRVILEQRAEYRHGAGIPEIYAASLTVESQLPLLKGIIWNWRRTVFILVGTTLFFFELFIVLVCCRPAIFPRARHRS